MAKPIKRKKPKRDLEDEMLTAVAAYLKTVGWKPIVIGGVRIEGPIGAKYNYDFVLRFTGGKVTQKETSKDG